VARVRVAIIGAGPTGLFLGAALQRRGHEVTVVDRDPGPEPDGTWPRKGVMQFHHAHAFRGQVAAGLQAEVPEALDRWVELGAEPVLAPGGPPGAAPVVLGMRSRRETFERALREVVAREPGLVLRHGNVRAVRSVDGVAIGLDVDGDTVPAELVLDASGRTGRVTRELGERAGFGGSCGIAYVDRQYQLHPGAEPGPLAGPIAWQGVHDGYQVLVFPHEGGIFSVLVVRASDDEELKLLRFERAFDAACAAVPALATWTDPDRAAPISLVLPGGELLNHYRGQLDETGRPLLSGFIAVGDAVGTTTPVFGRGVALATGQSRALLAALDEHGTDTTSATACFDGWCRAEIAPWVRDHLTMDTAMVERWAGADLDLERPLPSDRVLAAGARDPRIAQEAQPYLSMAAGPASLAPLQEAARRVYETGWRPAYSDGPSRDELARIVTSVA
jgi:2-polyprenyl-6-methoxyphenol hydroxylase-like FAD-dependent oxidoreductase